MKKNFLSHHFPTGKWKRIFIAINLIAGLSFCCVTQTQANDAPLQQKKVTASYRSATILSILEDLKAKTGYTFVYKKGDIDEDTKVTATFKDVTLDEVLKKILIPKGYEYSVEGRVIAIKRKPGTQRQPRKPRETITVTGRVTDDTGDPLPGVSVVINQTTRGVATDQHGRYEIMVKSDDVLKYSFIGFKDQTVPVEGKDVLNISLKSTTKNIDEVTVVAFGEQKKESVVGAITTINPGALKTSNSDLTASFVGRIPGMIGYLKGGMPGALTEAEMNTVFNIRGVTSFGNNSNTTPLILLDGVEVSVLELSRIDPEDIATFSVMKDASATAMYGARGANGVILVNSKKGEEGSVYTTARYEMVASKPTQEIDVVDPVTYMKAYNEALLGRNSLAQPKYTAERINNTNSGRYPDWVYPATDWYKQLFKDMSINHRAGLSVRGGSKIIQYYASLGLDMDQGMLKTDKLNQFDVNIKNNVTTLRVNLNIDMTPTSKLTINSSSSLDDYHGPLISVQNAYERAFNASPVNYAPVYPADANSNWPHIHFGYENVNSSNPYADIQQGYQETTRFATSNKLEYIQNLNMLLKGLEFRANVSYYKQSYEMLPFYVKPYKYRLSGYNQQTGEHTLELLDEGKTDLTMNSDDKIVYGSTQLTGEFHLLYNGLWGDHNVTYTGIFNIQQQASSAATDLFSAIKHRNMGTSMRLSYGFKERYYLEGSFGYNGSERFAKDNRFGFFPAVGGAWIVSKEPFMKNSSNWLSYLKLRLSYGKVGNDGIGTGDISTYGNTGRYLYLENVTQDSQNHYHIASYANPTIQWEVAEQANLGLEFAMFNGLLDCTIDAYQEIRHNILSQRLVVPASMGLGLYPYANIGKGRSRGIDFSGKIQHSFSNDFYFILNGTFTYSKATYLELEEGADKPEWQKRVGHDVSQQIGYIAEGLFQSQEEIDRSPKQSGDVMPGDIKYRDLNGDGKISVDDATYIGYPTSPRFVYGLSAFVYWNRWEFSCAFQGSGQRSLFMNPVSLSPFYGDHALLTEIWNDHWTPENMKSHPFWPRLSTNSISTHNMEEGGYGQETQRYSTYFMRPVKFLRCQQLMLAYSFPTKWIRKYGLQRVKPYVSVDNPFLISSFKLWDVELGSSGFNYPIQRTFSVGINVSF